MKFCFGTVCWGGYLERYVDLFVDNYITLYRKLIGLNINFNDIPDPIIVCNNETVGTATDNAKEKLFVTTGKKLIIIQDKHDYTTETIMYSTRNRLRKEYKKAFPNDKKVFFYFPIDDQIRPTIILELMTLSLTEEPTACMFKFMVHDVKDKYSAGTRPICSWKDIHPEDWGGYCAYNILNEEDCPLYPKVPIPNVAFYTELYKMGYKQYQSKEICVDHLRHGDSHHFKYKNTELSQKVRDYLLKQRIDLCEKGYN